MTSTEIVAAEKIMLGSTEATAMYIGSTLVWYKLQQQNLPIKFLDILYSDSNGNLSYTSEILPTSEGKTPIALCIAGEEFFGSNEKPRWMSLKYMNYTTPETGSLTSQGIYWGNYNVDISNITNISNTYNGGGMWGYLTSEWITGTQNKIPTLLDLDNEWNISILGTVNLYAVTDIDGKNKTLTIIATATAQPNWHTDSSITNNSGNNYAPAACCCQRYHTLGTYAGNWYLGAGGEMSIIVVRRNEINSKLLAISNIYSNDCISSLTNGEHWTSTENSNVDVYNINTNDGGIGGNNKNTSKYVIALLLYKSDQLPYDTELEYLESTGTQYINTGIINNNSIIIDMKMSASGTNCLHGSEYTYQYRFKWGADGNGHIYYGYLNNHTSDVMFLLDLPCTYHLKQGEQYVKDYQGNTILSSSETLSTYSTNPIMLFKCYSGSDWVNASGTIRIYDCKIYNNGVLMDLIPVRIGQTGYMYDKVSGQLYGNSGTGNFVLGPDTFKEIEYLESTGTLWIDTGIIPNTNTKVQFKFKNLEVTGDVIIGYYSTNDRCDWRLFNYNQLAYFDLPIDNNVSEGVRIFGNNENSKIYQNIIYELELGNYYVKNLDTNTILISGQSQTYTGISTITLNHHDYTNKNSKNEFYYVKIYDGDTLVRDLIPVRVDQIGYMYDKVSKLLFANAGTGNFTLGPDIT